MKFEKSTTSSCFIISKALVRVLALKKIQAKETKLNVTNVDKNLGNLKIFPKNWFFNLNVVNPNP